MSLKQEPELGKNFWLAMLLSMLVLIGYPYFMARFAPKPMVPPAGQDARPSAEIPALPNSPAMNAAPGASPYAPAEQAAQLVPAQAPQFFDYESPNYKIRFSSRGGTVLYLEQRGKTGPQAHRTVFFSREDNSAGTLGIRLAHEPADLINTVFEMKTPEPGANRVEFVYEKPAEYRLTKTFILSREAPVIHVEVAVENLSPYEKHYPLELAYNMDYDPDAKADLRFNEAIAAGEKIETAKADKIVKKGFFAVKPALWAGLAKKYYILAVRPEWKIVAVEARGMSGEATMNGLLRMEPLTLAAGERQTRKFLVYAGPQHYESLKQTGAGFEAYFSRGFLGVFKVWLLLALKFLYGYVLNYGWSIIILTVLIKILFAPITHISFESQRKMQAIQPKMKSLQERYKGNAEKLHKETMALFKRNRVNPMAGCLPMLIQMPVLIAMYQLLSEAIELQGAPFLGWMHDLSRPDHLFTLPFTIPVLGWETFNLLPFIMIGSQYGFQKIMPQPSSSPDQAMVFKFMPLMFGFICYNMPSGLVLYWSLQNVLSIAHHLFVSRVPVILHHEDKD